MFGRPIPLGETSEHRYEAYREQVAGVEGVLMTQKVQFNQEFIRDPAMQGRNDVGEGLMKGALAVCNRLCASQRACSIGLAETLAPQTSPLGLCHSLYLNDPHRD